VRRRCCRGGALACPRHTRGTERVWVGCGSGSALVLSEPKFKRRVRLACESFPSEPPAACLARTLPLPAKCQQGKRAGIYSELKPARHQSTASWRPAGSGAVQKRPASSVPASCLLTTRTTGAPTPHRYSLLHRNLACRWLAPVGFKKSWVLLGSTTPEEHQRSTPEKNTRSQKKPCCRLFCVQFTRHNRNA
jgi:hypothetical protein